MTRRSGKILGLDTDVLVHWAMAGSAHHVRVRQFLDRELQAGVRVGISQQTLAEFVHVVTDPRRFQQPLTIDESIDIARELWHSSSVQRILPVAEVQDSVCDLMKKHRLGRKRILDTYLAATLEAAGIKRLATLNARDFRIFRFLDLVDPLTD